jgi:predicted Zn-dependent protease with MMP-like domain
MTDYQALSETEWVQVERILDLLEEGEIEEARVALDAMLRKRPKQPDLRIMDARIHLDEGEPAAALASLRGAEKSADPGEFFFLRAEAQFQMVRFAEARADVEQALSIHPDFAPAWDLSSRIKEHLGDFDGATKDAETAHALDPEACPLPLDVPRDEFDALVVKAVSELPERVRDKLKEIPVLVQDLPKREMLVDEDPPLSPDLLGLFAGRHIFARSSSELPSAPDAIYLFRRNLLRVCTDREDLAHEVRITVQHEVGHLMGLDEDELDDWGLA